MEQDKVTSNVNSLGQRSQIGISCNIISPGSYYTRLNLDGD